MKLTIVKVGGKIVPPQTQPQNVVQNPVGQAGDKKKIFAGYRLFIY